MAVVSANRLELLQIADAVAREKVIDRSIVIDAMEEAIAKAARSRYGAETDVHAEIDNKTGALRLSRHLLVVDQVENDAREITLDQARRYNPGALVGDVISDTLPPFDFGRVAAQSAKQVIVQKVRDAERARQFDEYKDRIGEILNGIVKRVEYGNVIVDLGRGEGIVRRDEMIPRETFRPGDRIRSYLFDVRSEVRGPQIFLSRSHPQFMAKLFGQEVPEIYDGIVEVKAVARDPGSRAKIAVISRDGSIDPVGACVGMRGSRVQAVVGELQGEKIDIIPWSEDEATFIVNALQPAEVVKVVLDEEADRIEVVVPDDQLSLAIGRRGQNVRLASQLTGWDIDILTEAEEIGAPAEGVRRADPGVHGGARRRRDRRPAARRGRLPQRRGDRLRRHPGAVRHPGPRRGDRRRDPGPRPGPPRPDRAGARRPPHRTRRRRRAARDRRHHHAHDGGARRERREDRSRTWRAAPRTTSSATPRAAAPRPVRHAGYLDGFDLSRAEAEALIMAARLKAGWIDALPEPEGEEGAEEGAGEAEGGEAGPAPAEA